jgi:hypothetical protein
MSCEYLALTNSINSSTPFKYAGVNCFPNIQLQSICFDKNNTLFKNIQTKIKLNRYKKRANLNNYLINKTLHLSFEIKKINLQLYI